MRRSVDNVISDTRHQTVVGLPAGVAGVLLDIEGTTTPIAFVHETLFPFARARYGAACVRASAVPAIAAALRTLRDEWGRDAGDPSRPSFGDGSAYAGHLAAHDRKSTGLKELQGLIWEEGYRSGELRAPVFADVPPALEAWREAGASTRIFSSGSVLAQKLLFAHTDHGDLIGLLEGFHDTTTGPKREAASYVRIASAFGLPSERVLFLSDVVSELDAARHAGMVTRLVRRPGNPPASPGDHAVLEDFRNLRP